MLMPRIIPCLDVRHGRVVKGVQFESLVDSGDPVELAWRYAKDGADELVWLDIMATVEEVSLRWDQIKRARERLNIPLTVGGGIRTLEDVEALLDHGADKVSINSQALLDKIKRDAVKFLKPCGARFGRIDRIESNMGQSLSTQSRHRPLKPA